MKKNFIIGLIMLYAGVVLATPLYAARVTKNIPVAYWQLDETIGNTAYDFTANDHDGDNYSVTKGVAGQYGTAYSFNGSNAYVDVNSLNPITPDTVKTFAAWVKPADLSHVGMIVGRMG